MGDLSNWEINDHNEIYVIKAESMKKSYDGIVKRLQKERVKYVKHQASEDEKQLSDLISSFSLLKSEFIKRYQTRILLQKSQYRLKKRFELVQDQLREQQNKIEQSKIEHNRNEQFKQIKQEGKQNQINTQNYANASFLSHSQSSIFTDQVQQQQPLKKTN